MSRINRAFLVLALFSAPAAAELEGETSAVASKDQATLLQLMTSVGIESVSVSSVERTPERQARVMFDLAKKDLDAALDMYCAAGDAVLKKYDPAKSREQNLEAMQRELIAQLPYARELGCLNHIKNDEVYAVDIGISQIPEEKRAAFIQAGLKAQKAKQVERFLYPPRDPDAFHFEFKREPEKKQPEKKNASPSEGGG